MNPIKKLESERQASQTTALQPLLSKKLISITNKLFRSASNTFWAADFVYISKQEIFHLINLGFNKYSRLQRTKYIKFYGLKYVVTLLHKHSWL